jgi:hypothetical protein
MKEYGKEVQNTLLLRKKDPKSFLYPLLKRGNSEILQVLPVTSSQGWSHLKSGSVVKVLTQNVFNPTLN